MHNLSPMSKPTNLQSDAARRALAAEKELDGFAYSVSHDFRGPLRTILGAAMIMEEDHAEHLNAEALDELKRIKRAAQTMSGLIDSLLRYSRLARQEMHPADFDLTELAGEVAVEIGRGHPEVDFDIAEGIRIHGDAALWRLICAELFDNAVKFGGKHVGLHVRDGELSYSDDGIGFEPKQAARIMFPLEQLNANEYAGTGMGLALVQRAVVRHGGVLIPEGEPNKGATFRICGLSIIGEA